LPFQEVPSTVDFPKLEKEILDFWEKHGIFEKSISSRSKGTPFIFYEGPPTANGKPGIHHVISRSIKDFVCRYKTMQGMLVRRKAGWDTHGLPVEIEIEKELGFQHKEQIEAYGVGAFNRKCRESVFRYVGEWNELTRRIGFWVDLAHPYITYENSYIETVWWLLAQMWKKNLLYQGFKILTYCPRCETPLSSHETSLGYRDVTERALTVKFHLLESHPDPRAESPGNGNDRYVLAWTTTPWTLPGNVALAVGADIDYAEVEQILQGKTETLYVAEARLSMLKGEYRVVRTLKGSAMVGWKYKPLFDFVNLEDPEHPAYHVAAADFVNTEEGTGVVHTAVMYGEDDYRLGLKIGLPAKHTVDEKGRFNERVPKWEGRYVKDPALEQELVDDLKANRRFYRQEQYTHAYPHCWRCDSPLLYYARKSWYLKTTAVKDQLIENNKTIRWFPKDVGEGRFGQWLENNIDWAISRDRYWGTPLNIWICGSCKSQQAVESVAQLKEWSGAGDLADLHKPEIDGVTFPCPKCGKPMHRTPEVIDCWFDSGAMPYAQFHYPFAKDGLFEANFPADFISEGIDQTRGWFYSMLVISTLISGKPSYKDCVSIELILDRDGQKMSKSRGNSVDPFRLLDKEGADPLRWYLLTVSPPWVPTRFDEEGVREVLRKFFGTLSNTYSFFVLYANIDGFAYGGKPIPVAERPEIDRWLISSRNTLVKNVRQYLDRYDLSKAGKSIQDFVIDDVSNWYVRRNRRRFWKSEMNEDKRSAYQTLFETLLTLTKLIAPFAPFLSESMYRNLNGAGTEPFESVHLAAYPDPGEEHYRFSDEALETRMRAAKDVVSLCRAARNESGLKVRQPLARAVVHASDPDVQKAVAQFESLILEEINVRSIEVTADAGLLMEKQARPVFKSLGPKFGSRVNQAAERIKSLTAEEIGRLEGGETIELRLPGGGEGKVVLSDVEIITLPRKEFAVQADRTLTVGLDTRLDEGLVLEGLTRELVNRIQHMRKEAGFKVTDRIRLFYRGSDVLTAAMEGKKTHIGGEVLADSISGAYAPGEHHQEWDIDGEKITIGIQRTD
jgi:isoleucyl-tRNA synthetase